MTDVAYIRDTAYADLHSAVLALTDGDTIRLVDEVELAEPLDITTPGVAIVRHDGPGIIHAPAEGAYAIRLGSKSATSALRGLRLDRIRVTGGRLEVVAVATSEFYGVEVDGVADGAAVLFDTADNGGYAASINNRWFGGYIHDVVDGLRLTKDPADTGTDGCNHNQFFGLRVATFTGTGIDNDQGEFNSYYGCDSSTSFTGTTGVRINDDVCSFFGIRADNSSAGVGLADAYGIYVTATGRNFLIDQPTGNGPLDAKRVFLEDPDIDGEVRRDGFTYVSGGRVRAYAAGTVSATTRAWKNIGSSTISAGEIAYFNGTCGEGEVKRSDQIVRANPLVCVKPAASGGVGQFAEPGSVVTVNADTGVVAVGDTLVCSTTQNGRAAADNTQANPRYVIGSARSSKASGLGAVRVYIR